MIIVSDWMIFSSLDPSINAELKWFLQTALISPQTVFAASLMLLSVMRVLLLGCLELSSSFWMLAIKLRNTDSVLGNLDWERVLLGYFSRYFTFFRDPVPAPKLGPGFEFPWLLVTRTCKLNKCKKEMNLIIDYIFSPQVLLESHLGRGSHWSPPQTPLLDGAALLC